MAEQYDIINERDEIVGKATKKEAHAQHLRHRAIQVVISNSQGEILLQLRKSTKKQYPLQWTVSVAGHVSAGEIPEAAAYREMLEEIGIWVPLEYHGKFAVDDEVENEMIYVYCGDSDGPFRFDENEMEKAEWFSLKRLKEEMSGMVMTPHFRRVLQLLFGI